MVKKISRNIDILKDIKNIILFKIYLLLVELVNKDREDLVEDVLKIDYFLMYISNCIKDKDFREVREIIERVKVRIDKLLDNNFNVDYLFYFYNGINFKIK